MQTGIEKICLQYNLGTLLQEPTKVTGGLLHQMYHVVTDQGEYAIKILNPDIMKRSTALPNMINSELVTNQFKGIIPLVAAKSFEGKHVIEYEGAYYIIFDWMEAASVFEPEITTEHCAQIGTVLGQIHAANIQVPSVIKDELRRETYKWKVYLEKARKEHEACYVLLKENLPDIVKWDEGVVNNLSKLSQCQVISHRDLDPKNVLWKDNMSYVIDWESAGYVNPYQELVEVLNYWIVNSEGKYNKDKFISLMKAYTKNVNIDGVNWQAVLKCSYDGMLGWLEYSVKRTLGIEGSGTQDKQEGLRQTESTIRGLKMYEMQMDILLEWMTEMKEIVNE